VDEGDCGVLLGFSCSLHVDVGSTEKEQVARAPGSVMTSARSHGLLSSRSCSRSTPSLRPPLKLKVCNQSPISCALVLLVLPTAHSECWCWCWQTRVPPLANSKHRLPRPASSRSIPVPVSPLVSPSPSPSFRQRAEEIRTLQSQLEARGRAEMNLGNAASMSTIKALFSKMKRVDKRKYVLCTVIVSAVRWRCDCAVCLWMYLAGVACCQWRCSRACS